MHAISPVSPNISLERPPIEVQLASEWKAEYNRLGNRLARISAYLIMFTYPLGILADIDYIPKGQFVLFLGIQLFPTAVVAVAMLFRRFVYHFSHEVLVMIMACSLFLSASHKVAGEDVLYYIINNGLCFGMAAVLMLVRWHLPLIIFGYVLVINFLVERYIYEADINFYYTRGGGIIVAVMGLGFVAIAQFRYQIVKQNFLNSLALKQSYEQLSAQNRIIEENNKTIREINQDLTASINYAQRIQQAILPSPEELNNLFAAHFVLYLPRDIVSGDFYWATELSADEPAQHKIVLAVADCTGHGVPGALMSMLGAEALSNIVINEERTHAHLILEDLQYEIRQRLRQRETQNQDGMDIGVLVWQPHTRTLEFAGARNNLVLIQNDEMTIVKGDKMPIGGFQHISRGNENETFTLHTYTIAQSCMCYLHSDGYTDQFGGKEGKRFMTGKLHKLLYSIHTQALDQQCQILYDTFLEWKNASKDAQLDDVLVMGVHIC